jgi:hypothetical protein
MQQGEWWRGRNIVKGGILYIDLRRQPEGEMARGGERGRGQVGGRKRGEEM